MTALFSFPEHQPLAQSIASKLDLTLGRLNVRHFPDGESYVRILSAVKDQEVAIVCGLDQPDYKIMSLLFFCEAAREFGATKITLVAPYLGYMRQDKRFHDGEAISSRTFAKLLSKHVDQIITVDPHLHRYHSLDEIYSIPSQVIHATNAIASWIQQEVENPLLIGPDEESEQWVSEVANQSGAPFTVLRKIRHGDRDVEMSVPNVEKYHKCTPILVDDIISTARTMIGTILHLEKLEMSPPICIGVHAIFAEDGYEALLQAHPHKIVTCNTIQHPSNQIDLSLLLADAIRNTEGK